MKPDKKKALQHFKENVLPRRCRDHRREEEHFKSSGKRKVFFRKVLPDEQDRAESYPMWTAGLNTFAHFGIGIGIYYMQLLMMGAITFVCGLIMINAMYAYGNGYGSSSFFFTYTAACQPAEVIKDVKVDGRNEDLEYRGDCALPFSAALADLAMSLFFFVMIFITKLAENQIEEELDEAVQTAQDYSVCVLDPNKDAEDPDEWYEFFSRFGKVRYVTITRKNKQLTQLIAQKHALTRKLEELHSAEFPTSGQERSSESEKAKSRRESAAAKQYEAVNRQLGEAYNKRYSICRVYVTFEREEHQRRCLQETEVPDLYAIFDWRGDLPQFRGSNVLDISEPPEPDSVLWANVELSRAKQLLRLLLAYSLIALLLAAIFFAVLYANEVSPLLLSVVIAVIDSLLPPMFQLLVDIGAPQSQGQRQSEIQMSLFLGRLLLSIAFPYYFSNWHEAVTEAFIQQVVTVQLTASFLAPILQGLDLAGVFSRHVLGPLFADTQGELNAAYAGSKWTLAEKYTGIAKIIFLAVFYTLLNPFSPLIAMLALCNVFFIDRFLLLRRLEPSCMLDSEVARRLRQQALLAIAAHMYITLRYIYSWPMDEVHRNSNGDFEYADKFPPYLPIHYTSRDWHSRGQRNILAVYRIAFFVVAVVVLYIWIVDPIIHALKRLLCSTLDIVGDTQNVGFSNVEKIMAYVPLIQYKSELFFCSYIVDMLPRNKPSLIRPTPGDRDDLSSYVPIQLQPHVLSTIKYYGDNMLEEAMNINDATTATAAAGGAAVRTEAKDDAATAAAGFDIEAGSAKPQQQQKLEKRQSSSQQGILSKIVGGLPAELKEKVLNKSSREVSPEESFFPSDSTAAAASSSSRPNSVKPVATNAATSSPATAGPVAAAVHQQQQQPQQHQQESPAEPQRAAADATVDSPLDEAQQRQKKARRVVRNRGAASANFAQVDATASAATDAETIKKGNRIVLKPIR